jgi:Methyltransferase domain
MLSIQSQCESDVLANGDWAVSLRSIKRTPHQFGRRLSLPTRVRAAVDTRRLRSRHSSPVSPPGYQLTPRKLSQTRPFLHPCAHNPVIHTLSGRSATRRCSDLPNMRVPGCSVLFLWHPLQFTMSQLQFLRTTPLAVDVPRRTDRLLSRAPASAPSRAGTVLCRAVPATHGRRYVTIDKYSDRADHQADVTALLFADASFDTALSCHVLEHVEDDQSAIAELARVLHPAAGLLSWCPTAPTGRLPMSVI